MRRPKAVLLPLLMLLTSANLAAGQDWPGLWGPARNATTAGRPIRDTEVMWRRPVAGGYSEIAVHDGRAVTMEMRDGDDFIVALDAATGREQWSVRVGPTYKGHGGSDDGPISTPAVAGQRRVCARPARPPDRRRCRDRQGEAGVTIS